MTRNRAHPAARLRVAREGLCRCATYPSLWEWCLRVLHLREGATARRLAAMRVLRKFPSVAEPLRDGRLCLSTAATLAPVLTAENCEELVARAAFMTKAEVEHLVASVQPRAAPREGVRLVSSPAARALASAVPSSAAPQPEAATTAPEPGGSAEASDRSVLPEPSALQVPPPRSRPALDPVSSSTYSLRVTIDAGFKQELDELRALLAHKLPGGDLAAVLREGVRCAIEKHGKRKGAVAPSRKPKAPPAKAAPAAANDDAVKRRPIPAAVRREVWKRDGGQCSWRSEDGHRCGSTWKLELDHLVPAALGGPSTFENLAVRCRAHNLLSAERDFGRAHMDQFRRTETLEGRIASAGRSGSRLDGSSATKAARSEPGSRRVSILAAARAGLPPCGDEADDPRRRSARRADAQSDDATVRRARCASAVPATAGPSRADVTRAEGSSPAGASAPGAPPHLRMIAAGSGSVRS